MVFTPALKAALTGLLAILPSPYLYCKSGGWGLDTACPRLVNTVDSFTQSTVTAGHRLVPRWYGDPPDPIAQQILQFAEDARKWSMTTDLIVAPTNAFELAQWTTDLIVRPPGDMIVWVPPSEFLAGLRSLVPPTPAVVDSDTELIEPSASVPGTAVTGTVFGRIADNGYFNPRHMVMAFYALVIGFIAVTIIHLAPAVRIAWNKMVVDYTPAVLAVLGRVGRAIFGSLLRVSSPTLDDVQRIFGGAEVTVPNRRERRSLKFAAPRIIRDHALMASPRLAVACDLANWTPAPQRTLRSLLVVFQDGSYPTPLALERSETRPRTFSAMTFMEAKPARTSGPLTMALLVEEEYPGSKRTLKGAKSRLRRQAPGMELFGLWKRRVRRHQELRELRDEMGVDNALRHAQEGHAILRSNLRSMMGIGEQLPSH
ncbi:hypothetical protein FOMPIDRAFT_89964 [Fomitopsis schrenkii]|uniref:Uncharacterized protein n=1 Tax=Fomitopsis schrenkii TaxID=2126942 RepID=S8DZN5_FOMSC|nr:hypothetical protein FOMPIDRAFT_89964 [Fomitopsis schrenkii]